MPSSHTLIYLSASDGLRVCSCLLIVMKNPVQWIHLLWNAVLYSLFCFSEQEVKRFFGHTGYFVSFVKLHCFELKLLWCTCQWNHLFLRQISASPSSSSSSVVFFVTTTDHCPSLPVELQTAFCLRRKVIKRTFSH